MTNNEILKKLRIALQLKDTDIIEILKLANFEISKGALGDIFRSEDQPGYVEAGDQIVRNFLNGLIIYKRGPMTQERPEKKTTAYKKPITNIVPKILEKENKGAPQRGKTSFKKSPNNNPTQEGNSTFKKSTNIETKNEGKTQKQTKFGKDFFMKKG